MEISKAHWLGTSMGGLIALAMAEKGHADFFKTVVFIDITHKPNRSACKRVAGYMTEAMPVLQSVEQYISILKVNLPLGDVSEDVWRHYAENQLVRTDSGYIFHFDPKITRRAKIDLCSSIDMTDGLRKLLCPVALVAGEISDFCTSSEIVDFRSQRPDAQVHICKGAGHVPALSDRLTQDFILEFLDQPTRRL